MTDKDKVWDRLKYGLRETEAERCIRFSNEYFDGPEWAAIKDQIIKECIEVGDV